MRKANNTRYRHAVRAALIATLFGGISFASQAETVVVEMQKYKFIPAEITIKAGDTVRWLNTERRQYHTVWFKAQGEKETPELYPGESYEKTFNTTGDYPYLCGPHWEKRDMKGLVHVVP